MSVGARSRKRIRHVTLVGLVVVLAITSLAACSDESSSPTPTITATATSTPTPTQEPTPTPTQEPNPSVVVGGAENMEVDIGALLDGVGEISAPGVPGPLCIFGSEAFPVIVGAIGEVRAPVMAASRWQAGRIVALGHDGYFTRTTLKSLDTGHLIVNALHWSAGGESSHPRIGVVGATELRTWLQEGGHDVVEVSLTPDSLRAVDVVALVISNLRLREFDALSSFVRDGGGLVTAMTGWGWAQLHAHLDLVSDYAGNRLLAHVGIRWSHDYLWRTSPEG